MYAFILFIILIEPCHVKTSLRGLRPEIQNSELRIRNSEFLTLAV